MCTSCVQKYCGFSTLLPASLSSHSAPPLPISSTPTTRRRWRSGESAFGWQWLFHVSRHRWLPNWSSIAWCLVSTGSGQTRSARMVTSSASAFAIRHWPDAPILDFAIIRASSVTSPKSIRYSDFLLFAQITTS
jgi:hypothetical protein